MLEYQNMFSLHLLIYTYVLFILSYELNKTVKRWGIENLRRNILHRRVFPVLKIIIFLL